MSRRRGEKQSSGARRNRRLTWGGLFRRIKTETGLEVGKTWSLQFRCVFPDAGFELTNLSVSGCDIHPFARLPVRAQFFVNQLKQIALIGTALFFETEIG